MLGDKNRPGLLQTCEGARVKKNSHFDLNTMEYREKTEGALPSIEAGKAVEDTRERLRALIAPLFGDQKTDKRKVYLGGLSESASTPAPHAGNCGQHCGR